jgi:hypothetical protein
MKVISFYSETPFLLAMLWLITHVLLPVTQNNFFRWQDFQTADKNQQKMMSSL